jgi:hypothetical protein
MKQYYWKYGPRSRRRWRIENLHPTFWSSTSVSPAPEWQMQLDCKWMNCTFANESYPSFLDFGCVEFHCGNEHSNNNNGTEHSVHLEIAWFVKSYGEKKPDYEAKIRRGIEVLTILLIIRNRMHSLTVTAYLCSSWEREKEKKRKTEQREKRSRKENKQ